MNPAFRKLAISGKKFALKLLQAYRKPVLKNKGYCHACTRNTTFVSREAWLRDHYKCSHCGSIPRERALMLVIEEYFPNWRRAAVHESSPSTRGASKRLRSECSNYIASQFFPDSPPGSLVDGVRCENLEAMTFPDESIDLHVTQDVFEHVLNPSKAFAEIARTLRPGGAHIFTVPLVNKDSPSGCRAYMGEHGQIIHLEPPAFHGNPISDEGSLVTMDWGYDISDRILDFCGLQTQLVCHDDLNKGIRAEYIEVLVTVKPLAHSP